MHTVLQIGRPPTTAGTRIPLPLEGACAFLDGRALVILVAPEAPDPAEREAVEQGRARVRTAGCLISTVSLTADAPVDLVCRLPVGAADEILAPVTRASAASSRLVVALCDTESGLLVALCQSALPASIAHAIQTPDGPETTQLRRTG